MFNLHEDLEEKMRIFMIQFIQGRPVRALGDA